MQPPGVSNLNALLGQNVCQCLYEGRTLNDLLSFQQTKVLFRATESLRKVTVWYFQSIPNFDAISQFSTNETWVSLKISLAPVDEYTCRNHTANRTNINQTTSKSTSALYMKNRYQRSVSAWHFPCTENVRFKTIKIKTDCHCAAHTQQ